MEFWYVQTWSVSQNKVKEHDEAVKKLLQFITNTFEYYRARKPKIFRKKLGNRRIFIVEHDNMADYEKQMDILEKDPEFLRLRAEWSQYSETNWDAEFWEELEY